MKTPKPPCATLHAWLKANLGPRCLAPLTSTDARALAAAVHIVELYGFHSSQAIRQAFGEVVRVMQPHTRELAYHAIAHILNWSTRAELWKAADLPPIEHPLICAYEPGGRAGSAAPKSVSSV